VKKLLGRSGAHKCEQKEATFAVGPMNNMEVPKSLKRVARAEIAPERAETSSERMWASRAALGHGTGWQATKCDVCTENDKGEYDVEVRPEWSSQRCGTCHEKSGTHCCFGCKGRLRAGQVTRNYAGEPSDSIIWQNGSTLLVATKC
jgi:hypothetical protein